MKLSDLRPGESGIIVKVLGRGAFRKRIIEMGFVKGKKVEVITKAPLKDPTEYKIMDYEISLRRSEAELVEIITEAEALSFLRKERDENYDNLDLDDDELGRVAHEHSRVINVALVGNPNSGKTSLFNIASGTHERVGNYSGVTVDAKEGRFSYKGYRFNLIDLPGTYSLSPYSPEELYVRKHINEGTPDIIINVISASNLERNLYLTTQLIDMDATAVIALNMYDELEKSGATFDYERLGKMIGYPVVPTIAKSGSGINQLFDKVIDVYEGNCPIARHIHINYGEEIETGIKHVKNLIKKEDTIGLDVSRRYLSILLLEEDKEAEEFIKKLPGAQNILRERDIHARQIKEEYKEDTESAFADIRYGFIDGALKKTFKEGKEDSLKITHLIDKLLINKYWGLPIFFLFIFLMFQGTFFLGEYPMAWIESLVGWIGEVVGNNMERGPFKELLTGGIINGVGSVIVFLPNIVILYLFISFMEDTGYMARAAFIMDKFMQKMGLHGKSFIPLIMGFGCNVPAIMGARIIESRNTRLITILINPLMSCSARLPVYLLLAGAFFPNHGGIVLFSLYLTGILLAIAVSRILKRFLIKGEDLPFVMELPPYRMPTMKATLRHMWDRTSQYLRKMGGIILVASIIIWFLGYFPQNKELNNHYEALIEQVEKDYVDNPDEAEKIINQLDKQRLAEHQPTSYIGRIGHWTEPLVRPLGFDWKISASLLSGMAAKEIVVSTMGILYTGDGEDDDLLRERLPQEHRADGSPAFTPLIALSLLVFVLIYFPCIATIAAIRNESGSWKWALFTVVYTTTLAWIMSFAVYQIGSLFT
ncbi:ferrous iron transport protein B [Bacteroidales bacterium OttesenSCG-928-M11]|nr:ferrous iron transport protein B [Bacteroidales bacterium OttesenSCG-928-M11]